MAGEGQASRRGGKRRDGLRAGFAAPPQAARPRAWWHWMDGNVSAAGISADLGWMHRIGLGGVHNFHAALQTPRLVGAPADYRSPEWAALLRHAVATARRLGMEYAVAGAPGWSETGGPWVAPADAMKKLVWSETLVDAAAPGPIRLAAPPSVAGPFGAIGCGERQLADGRAYEAPACYWDQAVIAFPTPEGDRPLNPEAVAVTSSAGTIDAVLLCDGDLTRPVVLPFSDEAPLAWIAFTFAEPVTVRALTLGALRASRNVLGSIGPGGWLEASDDGARFTRIAALPTRGAEQLTIAFGPARARIFRVVFEPPEIARAAIAPREPPPAFHRITELVLHAGARIDRFEDKAGFSKDWVDPPGRAGADDRGAIARPVVLDLTDRLGADGRLDWQPLAGRWTVLRLGCSLTGSINHPAQASATGLEVDKLCATSVAAYAGAYLKGFEEALGDEAIGSGGLSAMVVDSFEAGPQNWTLGLIDIFAKRLGYDMRPWLAALTGRVVGDRAASDRFLWDFRRLLGQLIADNHYDALSRTCAARGMIRYGESHENGRAFQGDGIAAKRSADIPMGAMWSRPSPAAPQRATSDADTRETASTAHLYGRRIAAAEAFTTFGNPYGDSPRTLKATADRLFANGINRVVVHCSVHQPDDRPGPGLGLGPFGQWFTRKETWAEFARPWIDYLARSSFLLQHGKPIADIAWLYGEDRNLTELFAQSGPAVPEGYGFDFVNSEAVLERLSVEAGMLRAAGGMRYRLLVLDPSTRRMSLALLRKLRQLVARGALIAGAPPEASPSLADNPERFAACVAEIWSRDAPWRDRVLARLPSARAMARLGIAPDWRCTGPGAAALRMVHRASAEDDIYFVSNPGETRSEVVASFRAHGRAAELWRAETGESMAASFGFARGRTQVPLVLEPGEALFVVLRECSARGRRVAAPPFEPIAEAAGPWSVLFESGDGPARTVAMPALRCWSEHEDPEVRYFSGTATYATSITLPDALPGELRLELGEVAEIAEVWLNGACAGITWRPPFLVPIAGLARPGDNRLEIRVANLWPNRLIGDKQPGACPRAFAAHDPFAAQSQLLRSGLFGPVRILGR